MFRNLPKSRRQSSWSLLLGLLCLALVVLGGTVQAVHTHPNGDLAHSDCTLCASAHVVAQVVATPAPIAAVLVLAGEPVSPPLPRLSKPSVFALFTRPPPVVS